MSALRAPLLTQHEWHGRSKLFGERQQYARIDMGLRQRFKKKLESQLWNAIDAAPIAPQRRPFFKESLRLLARGANRLGRLNGDCAYVTVAEAVLILSKGATPATGRRRLAAALSTGFVCLRAVDGPAAFAAKFSRVCIPALGASWVSAAADLKKAENKRCYQRRLSAVVVDVTASTGSTCNLYPLQNASDSQSYGKFENAGYSKPRRCRRGSTQPRGSGGRYVAAAKPAPIVLSSGCAAAAVAAPPAPRAPLVLQQPQPSAFAPAPAALPAFQKCAAKADADVGDGTKPKPRSRPPLPGARALTPIHAAVPGRFLQKEQPGPQRTAIPSHLRGADRAAWIEQQAETLACQPPKAPPAAAAPVRFEPPTAADWVALTDEQLAAAESMPPTLRDTYVRMMARLPAQAPTPARASPPVRAPAAAPPPAAKPKPRYRYRQPGDHAVADATWLAFEVAPLPCMQQVEPGRTPPSVPQLVKFRFKKSSWKGAVAALLHRAPGTIKASPVAFVVGMARQIDAGTARDPRGDEHWFAVDSWPQRMRQFAGREPIPVEKLIE